jgi:hypothetical protein
VGEPLPLPSGTTEVEDPDGERHAVDGSLEFRATRRAGIYRSFAGDSLVDLTAVNTPLRESLLAPLDADALEERLGAATVQEDPDRWARVTFTRRQGWESWRALLAAALVLLLVETAIAASHERRTRLLSAPPAPRSGTSGLPG